MYSHIIVVKFIFSLQQVFDGRREILGASHGDTLDSKVFLAESKMYHGVFIWSETKNCVGIPQRRCPERDSLLDGKILIFQLDQHVHIMQY